MPIRALATDYDGTLASHGVVSKTTLEALLRLKASGRKLLMVTGRELPDLRRVFPEVDICDAVVAENGALLYRPGRTEEALGPRPPTAFIDELRRRKVVPLAIGRAIVATLRTNEAAVAAAIEGLELPWRMIFNNESLMILPEGVDKASGLVAGLRALRLTPADALGVGDAENDHAFLAACGLRRGRQRPARPEGRGGSGDQGRRRRGRHLADRQTARRPPGPPRRRADR